MKDFGGLVAVLALAVVAVYLTQRFRDGDDWGGKPDEDCGCK